MTKITGKPRPNSESLSAAKRRLGPVEYRPIDSLKAYERNPRRHPERQLTQLGASIKQFGFCLPVLVDANGTIIAGHARIEAARRVALDDVPVLVAAGWTDAQVRAFRIADNRLTELSSWDDQLLTLELSELVQLDELPLDAVGWDAAEIDLVTGNSASPDPADAAPEPPQVPASQMGDVWLLGLYKLACTSGEAKPPFGRVPPADFYLTCVDAALRRWALTTGKQPVLADTGESFRAVAARRAREAAADTSSPAIDRQL